MKKVIVVFLTSSISSFLYSQTLTAYYPFNGNANDRSGNNNHGQVNGPTLATDRFGFPNNAYFFDGVDDYIYGAADNFPSGDRTIAFWFRMSTSGNPNKPGLFGYGGDGSCGSSFWMGINNQPSAINSYQIQSHCNNNQIVYAYDHLPEYIWVHWVVTIQGSTSRIYLDGKLASTGVYSTNTVVAGKQFSIGAIVSTTGVAAYTDANIIHFQGLLDDIKIFNGAMTANQVQKEFFSTSHLPGSGKTAYFDNESMIANTTGYTGVRTYTVELWLKTTSNAGGYVWETNDFGSPRFANNWNPDGSFDFYVGNAAFLNTGPIEPNRWYHFACMYNESTDLQELYVNGKKTGSNTVAVSEQIGPVIGFMNRITFPAWIPLNGELDEVRIWNIALTEPELRTRMCSRILPDDPLYANLVGYFNMDMDEATYIRDLKGMNHGLHDNMYGHPVSGAPIGDASAFSYLPDPTVTLAHSTGETLSITTTSGSPDGVHIYRVDERPNHILGAPGAGGNNRYFGVFVTGGTSPQYSVTYMYNGNPFVTTSNEGALQLFKRTDNAALSWMNAAATLNTTANTLTATGQNTEYILGLASGALPVTYTNFVVHKLERSAELTWKTESEPENKGFTVQRSADGIRFNGIGWVEAQAQPGDYQFIDALPLTGKNYYRLQQHDKDGRISYSEIRKLDFDFPQHLTVYPNPVNDRFSLYFQDKNVNSLQILNTQGQVVMEKNGNLRQGDQITVSHLQNGMYYLQIKNRNGEIYRQHFLKQ